jgi:N-acetyl-anhydromuramyl-L-alanine amidase AmpD
MARPLSDSPYLYGIHDPGGEHVMAEQETPGWILFTVEIGSDPNDWSGRDFRLWSDRGFGVMVRLNNGYQPAGTIPHSSRYAEFAQRCANYVQNSPGCHIWIIGNEPNHPVERPGAQGEVRQPDASAASGEVIVPGMYANCYRRCRSAIRALENHENDQIIVAAVAPWNSQTIYQGNNSGDWVKYLSDILMILGPTTCDGVAIHAYTHGPNPELIYTDTYMDPPFENRHFNFRVYQDFLKAIPLNMRSLPVYITESNQTGPWLNENSTWVQRVYGEINWWNEQPSNQKIHAVLLYRWRDSADGWAIEDKGGVIEDFRQAMAYRYTWPAAPTKSHLVHFIADVTPKTIIARQPFDCEITMRNAGNVAWPNTGAQAIRLGYRWRDSQDRYLEPVEGSDPFTSLPRLIVPGEQVKVAAHVWPPDAAGDYTLAWDLREAGRGWFADEGGAPLEIAIAVQPEIAETSPIQFEETGFGTQGAFAAFYRRKGVDITGWPISAIYLDATTHLRTQEWQRVVMEETSSGEARLANAGQQLQDLRKLVAQLQAQVNQAATPGRTGEDEFDLRTPPLITDLSERLPVTPNGLKRRDLEKVTYLVIDHTAVDPNVPVERIAEVHQAHWGAILYHYYVQRDGVIVQTHALDKVVDLEHPWVGAAINIALAGDFSVLPPPDAQLNATARLCAWLLGRFGLEAESIRGTCEFIATESPGQQWLHGATYKTALLKATARASSGRSVVVEPDTFQGQLSNFLEDLTQTRQLARDLEERLAAASTDNSDLRQQRGELERQLGQVTAQLEAFQHQAGIPVAPKTIPAPSIRDISGELPHHKTLRYATRSLDQITHIALHHSAGPANVSAFEIASYQVDRGWPAIGYHYYIGPDGAIVQTNALETVANHVFQENDHSIGICLAGSFDDVTPTPAQLDSTAHLLSWLLQRLHIRMANILGHQEFAHTEADCPGVQWLDGKRWKDQLLGRVLAFRSGEQVLPGHTPKHLGHYMLFWQSAGDWARDDWNAAQGYIGRFRPTAGFSVDDAREAEFVTIVGGVAGVPWETEQSLLKSGCRVERIAGSDAAGTARLLDEMTSTGRRFRGFNG